MKHTGHYLYLAFLMTTVFSLSPGTRTNYTHLGANNTTVWDPDIQNKTGRNQNENSNINSTIPKVDKRSNSTNMPEMAASSTPKSELDLYTPSVARSSAPTLQSTENTSKSHSEIFKKEVCEENNNKMAMLICLIIIAVLFLICTLLFLSTVILANKVSYLRRSKQAGKRQPRSNGDFLASSGLWPAESDTWNRAKQLTGPNLMMQSAGVLTATRGKKDEEGTGKLTN
ncbi:protein EVI2A [Pipistrellus kuhlii]|uniref:Ecotropic viral integration site 2A n=1 Tax=Pipistrellus kuhlii TaxID=59472 RepID=A0A7J7TL79_PIPKU|nr:protein EVI2A [Pipistrellus kuhlii]XP_036310307.1 protein EVI2A [Pipistrellus kuhlii]XP_036310308.1 protein EVI2A [Pipistrellus kuhlii]KAF6301117.1 ecotropic viral integration site 2A [Pipistrellus kuhlii]